MKARGINPDSEIYAKQTEQQEQQQERPDIHAWVRTCKISHPVLGTIALLPYDYQDEFLTDTAQQRLILKARQIGISQIAALEALYYALYFPGQTILFLSKDLDAAKNLLEYAKNAFENGCDKPAALRIVTDNKTTLRFSNGSKIRSIAATKNTGRSFSASRVYFDEFAFLMFAERIYQAASPTTSTGGYITILSTPDGRANLFYMLFNGDIGAYFSKHVFHWTRCPQYLKPDEKKQLDAALARNEFTPAQLEEGEHYKKYCEWYRRNRPGYTVQGWASEYECDFVQSGNNVFRDVDVDLIFKRELQFEPPQPGALYVTWWDIGRRHDATVKTTYKHYFDPKENRWRKRIVAWQRYENLPYPKIADEIDKHFMLYPGKHYIESNSIGDPLLEFVKTHVEGQFTSGKSKIDMITALQIDVEQHALESPPIPQLRAELLSYEWDDEKLMQDTVISAAGASYNTRVPPQSFNPAVGGNRSAVSAQLIKDYGKHNR